MATVCEKQGCDFVVLLGDNFYPSGVESTADPLWETSFVEPYKELKVPFYAVLGNHDYGGNGAGTDLSRGSHQVAYSKVNPKWRMPSTHHSWRAAHAEFFAADTNRSMFRLDGEVREDFKKWFGASTADWKIAFGHHPYRSNGRHGNAGEYDGRPMVPIANGEGVKGFIEEHICGRADVYLAGHDHVLEWLSTTCGREGSTTSTELLISGGGAGPTHFGPEKTPYYWHSAELGFAYVSIVGNRLTASYYNAEAVQLFSRTVARR
jgi:hypothetical protein